MLAPNDCVFFCHCRVLACVLRLRACCREWYRCASVADVRLVAVGTLVTGGDIYGMVKENELIDHAIMMYPVSVS